MKAKELQVLQIESRKEVTHWKNRYNLEKREKLELQKSVSLYDGTSDEYGTMSVSELNALKHTLYETIGQIETAKEIKDECVICKDKSSNIAIIGCGHCVMCEQCEQRLEVKACPRCQ